MKLRKQIKRKRPNFIRQDAHKKKRLGKKWRKPKGLHSKIRLRLRGRAKHVSTGYRSPRKARYLHKSGLQEQIIRSIRDLEGLDAKKNCLIISSSLGNRKRVDILKKAKEHGFTILNFNNPDEFIKKVEDKISLKREQREEKEKKTKEKKVEKKEGKLAEKVKGDKSEPSEDKKDFEKKEKDKVLIQKDK